MIEEASAISVDALMCWICMAGIAMANTRPR
jgi:hypothetical protein